MGGGYLTVVPLAGAFQYLTRPSKNWNLSGEDERQITRLLHEALPGFVDRPPIDARLC